MNTGIICQSDKMSRLLKYLQATAASDKPALLIGADGSGRSFIGKQLHEMSPGRDTLVELTCLEPSLSDRLLAAAHRACGGTLLITDLESLDANGQRDLRCLLAKWAVSKRSPRLVTTALPELEVRVKSGRFMRSLYDHVSVLRHQIPGLRERIEDLPALCRLLLTEHARTARREIPPLMPDGIAALRHYSWPGNIRELSNILLRAVLWFAGPLDGEAFRVLLSAETSPDELRLPIGSTLADAEKELILAALRANRTKTLTARQLGISRRTLYQKLARYRESGIAGGMP